MNINSSSVRFTLDFANKNIVGTKASFDKAGKGYGPIYEELVALMAKHPTFGFDVKEPKKPVKGKESYGGMDVEFMLDYCSAVGEAEFRAKLIKVRDFLKKNKKSVYPTVKKMFFKHFVPKEGERFAYNRAKDIVNEYRFNGIITVATSHTEMVEEDSTPTVLSTASNF